jgi:hypothetical protein
MRLQGRALLLLAAVSLVAAPSRGEHSPWWMREPIRLVQTNLPLHYVGEVDPEALAASVADYPANAWLLNLGGIYANYPTELDVQMPNPHLRPGDDFFGRAFAAAKARGLRVLARFDFSRVPRELHEAHPEWSFLRADGTPLTFAGLFQTCVNGDYYRTYALEILEEALGRYPVDGVFINWFGNQARNWYDGSENGTCHCPACREKWAATRGGPLPEDPFEAEYREFMDESWGEAADAIRELIHRVRPGAGLILYNNPATNDHVDSMTAESRTSFDDPQSWWPYDASLQIDRDRHDQPDKMVFSITVNFVNFRWRYVPHRPNEILMRAYQAMAYGGAPAYYMIGTLDQPDPSGPAAARPAFTFHAENEDLYVGQRNAARVLLVEGGESDPGFRGAYRLLAEEHVPFFVQSEPDLGDLPGEVGLVVSTTGPLTGLVEYLRAGGRALLTGTSAPPVDLPPLVRRWSADETAAAYWRVSPSDLLPSLKSTRTLFMSGPYLEYAGHEQSPLQLEPPALYGPPEMVSPPVRPAQGPGLLVRDVGEGRLVYLPWDAPGLYYEHSNLALRRLLTDLVDGLLPAGRQLRTDAHPLVEMVLMTQPATGCTLLHLLNHSGRLGASASRVLPIQEVEVAVAGGFAKARSRRLAEDLPVVVEAGYTTFTLPRLEEYDVVVLE